MTSGRAWTGAAALLLAAAAAPGAVHAAAPAGGTDRPLAASPDTARPAAETRERADKTERAGNGGERSGEANAPAPGVPDLGKLRAEYDRLREELFKARVRSQKAAESAFPSKLAAELHWKGSPDFVLRKARFLLDGAELWDSADRAQTDDLIEIAARSVKPGPHALTVRLDVRPKVEAKGGTKTGLDQLGYTSEHTFAIVVAETGTTRLVLTGDEDGDPPEYEPELELEIETEK